MVCQRTQHIVFVLCVISIAFLGECKRVYVKPNPASSNKRAVDLVQEIGKLRREFQDIGGFIIEVL